MNTQNIIADLTVENCKNVYSIINKMHPEWGVKIFNYNGQPLNDGEVTHTWGRGINSAVLNEQEFQYWGVVEFKN